jgi:hypothetical protein
MVMVSGDLEDRAMAGFVSAAVPFVTIGNRQCLTDKQLAEDRYLREFVERFRNCFEFDALRNLWIYTPPATAA